MTGNQGGLEGGKEVRNPALDLCGARNGVKGSALVSSFSEDDEVKEGESGFDSCEGWVLIERLPDASRQQNLRTQRGVLKTTNFKTGFKNESTTRSGTSHPCR